MIDAVAAACAAEGTHYTDMLPLLGECLARIALSCIGCTAAVCRSDALHGCNHVLQL